jgi:hypothetical protein
VGRSSGLFCARELCPPGADRLRELWRLAWLQSVDRWPEPVDRLNAYSDVYCSGDEYDYEAITHVMAWSSHLPGAFV